MGYILFLIESPGKVEKLTHVLGDKYKVMATVGHIMDLDSKTMSVDIKNNFTPTYIESPDKTVVIDKMRKVAQKADSIIFAADEDREGEMIAWSAAKILKIANPIRVTYNSITKEEILKSLEKPRIIDQALVDAQKSRRILDRLVGYEISPLLLKILKITNLSAGRVQSVVARLIVDREKEIISFFQKDISSIFKFSGEFMIKEKFNATLYHQGTISEKDNNDEDEINEDNDLNDSKKGIVKITKQDKAVALMEKFKKATFVVGDITEKTGTRTASPPFTTSTLQQEASRKLGYAIKRTMSVAQALYEAGYITYMRTDSTNLSTEALQNIGMYIKKHYGEEYHKSTQYTSKSKNTQEAHEAIRPTDVNVVDKLSGKKIGNDEIKLYNLIWKRVVASQMSPAKIKKVHIHIKISTTNTFEFVSEIESIVFAGFLKVYNISNIEEDNNEKPTTVLSKIPKTGEIVEMIEINGNQTYQKPPMRYNEASLVNKLDPKNLNIGRPATYASIINKIQERCYVKKSDNEGVVKQASTIILNTARTLSLRNETITLGKETNKIAPTELGTTVTNFLVENFPEIMDYKFTSHMEDKLDDVANGTQQWVSVMKEFYERFHPIVEKIKKNEKELVKKNTRSLGIYPTTKEEIVVTLARYGPVVKMKKDKKYVYAPIKEPLMQATITLEDAIKLFEYPKLIGKHEAVDILLNRGQYGHYLTYNKEKISIGERTEISLEEAVQEINKRKEKFLWTGSDGKKNYKVLNGPYGVYVNVSGVGKSVNVKLPADVDVKILTIEKIQELINTRYATKKAYRPRKKYTKKE